MDYSELVPYFKYYDSLVSRRLAGDDALCEGYMAEPWLGWGVADIPLNGAVIS